MFSPTRTWSRSSAWRELCRWTACWIPIAQLTALDGAHERDHQPVAKVLHLLPAVGARHVAQQSEVHPPQPLGLVIAQLRQQLG